MEVDARVGRERASYCPAGVTACLLKMDFCAVLSAWRPGVFPVPAGHAVPALSPARQLEEQSASDLISMACLSCTAQRIRVSLLPGECNSAACWQWQADFAGRFGSGDAGRRMEAMTTPFPPERLRDSIDHGESGGALKFRHRFSQLPVTGKGLRSAAAIRPSISMDYGNKVSSGRPWSVIGTGRSLSYRFFR